MVATNNQLRKITNRYRELERRPFTKIKDVIIQLEQAEQAVIQELQELEARNPAPAATIEEAKRRLVDIRRRISTEQNFINLTPKTTA